jgi:nucleoside-triphosphatase THEP1
VAYWSFCRFADINYNTTKGNFMKIAYTMSSSPGDTDEILAHLATGLAERGLRTCGVAQINTTNEDCQHPCDMDVQVLPDGPVIRISQSLGREAKGCRLNPAALENAVAEVSLRLHKGADVLILNKFGKHEADGRGFRDVIAEALSQGIPVITGVNKQNLDAFLEFTDGIAVQVPATIDDLSRWLNTTKEPLRA